jgi:signal transduction histidine kinase
VSRSKPPQSAKPTLGFRRDLQLFLIGLIGFLVIIIVSLVLLLRRLSLDSRDAYLRQMATLADAAVRQICDEPARRLPAQQAMESAQLRFGIAGIVLERGGGAPVVSGLPRGTANTVEIGRQSCRGSMYFVFEAADLDALRRRTSYSAAICLAAAGVGIVLLLLYLPRIVRPIEQLLEEATKVGKQREGEDETEYVISTFRASIKRLEEQEAELRRQHEREKNRAETLDRITKTLTRSMPSGFIALNGDGAVVSINGAAAEILGCPPAEEMQPAAIEQAVGESPFGRALRDAFARREAVSRIEVAHGERVVGLTTVPLVAERGVLFGMLALFTDLTSIRELEGRVRDLRAFADLGEVSAGIAHEFRNSLSTVIGYLRLVRRSDLSAQALTHVQQAEREIAALAEAVEALLRFAQPIRLDRQRFEVREAAQELVERMKLASDTIAWSVEGVPVEVEGDRPLVMRALENVLRNAVDAVRQSEAPAIAVTVRVAPRGGMAVVTVSDNGAGVDPKDVSRFFLPFQSDKPSGFGLGLPLAKKIVLLHGGTLTLAPGTERGAVATIELPQLQG